jgi:hypothetical protein
LGIIKTAEIINADTLVWAIRCGNSFLLRFIQLKVSKIPLFPLLAPRGLITILLFCTEHIVNKSLIIQVILMTIIMMLGLMITAKKENNYRRKRKAKTIPM